jgi:hypothetical protein
MSHNYDYLLWRRIRQRTAALQDAHAPSNAPNIAKRLGVRLSSAALASNCDQCVCNSETPHQEIP